MKWLSNVFKESLEQILKETKVNLGSVLRHRVSPKQPSKYFSYLIISSSSFSVCLPSLVINSNESLCHPPNLSTTRGMKTIPSASHLSLYFPTLILKVCWTPFSSSLATCPASCCWRAASWPRGRAGHQQGGHRCQGEAPQALSADPGLLEMQLQGELNGRKEIKNNEHETHLKKPQLDLLHLMKQKLSLALMSVTGIIFSWRLI